MKITYYQTDVILLILGITKANLRGKKSQALTESRTHKSITKEFFAPLIWIFGEMGANWNSNLNNCDFKQ